MYIYIYLLYTLSNAIGRILESHQLPRPVTYRGRDVSSK